MKRSSFDTLLSFLLGFAWALLFIGSWFVFDITLVFGFPAAFLATVLFVFGSLFCILILEGLHLYGERAAEAKEQTRLLRRIAERLEQEA